MSSTQSSFSQVKPRGKFLRVIGGEAIVYNVAATDYVLSNTTGISRVGNVISGTYSDLVNLSTNFNSISAVATSGSLLKDLGSELVINISNGTILQKMRLVQLVSGPTTEGVPPAYPTNDTFYVDTFNAGSGDFPSPSVVRVG